MGREQFDRPVFAENGFIENTETVTLSSAMQTLSDHGASFVTYPTSGKPNDAVIPDPPFTGATKYIAVNNQTTSLEANFNLNTTARTFFGSTNNTVTVNATGVTAALALIANSTSSWAVVSQSDASHWAYSASTGSTGQS